MPTRERAYLDGKVVTIIERSKKPKRNPKVIVRTSYGMRVETRARSLTPIENDDTLASFTYGE